MTPRPFLAPEPPPWLARALAALLLLALGAGVALAVWLPLPRTIRGPVRLVPAGGADPVSAPVGGVVTEVPFAEGDPVRAGDVLVRLRAEAAAAQVADAVALAGLDGRLATARALADSAADTRALEAQRAELDAVARALKAAQGEVAELQTRLDRSTALVAQHALSEEALAGDRLALSAARRGVDALVASRASAEGRIAETEARIRRAALELAATEQAVREQRATLLAQQAAWGVPAQDGQIPLRAPCDGSLLRLDVHRAGAVVAAGQPLAEVACVGVPLLAEIALEEGGLGEVAVGQKVRLYLDAYPYGRYGVGWAELSWVGPSSLEAGFLARARLIPGGPIPESGTLMAGLTGRAEIVTGSETFVDRAFTPIRALRQDLQSGP